MSEHERDENHREEQRNTDSNERLPWSSPTLTDLGAVSEVTEGISYRRGDGLTNSST